MPSRKRCASSALVEEKDFRFDELRRIGAKLIDDANCDTISHVQMTLQLLVDEANAKNDAIEKEAVARGLSFQGETKVSCKLCQENTMDPDGDYVHYCGVCKGTYCHECFGIECDHCDKAKCSECSAHCPSCETNYSCNDCATKYKCAYCDESICSDCLVDIPMYDAEWCTKCRDTVLLDREY